MAGTIDRRRERKELSHTIEILDVINGGVFGELVNVTVEGMMAIVDREIPTQSIFQLSFQLPEKINNSDRVELGADCLWCRKADNFHRFWAGFQIIDASDDAIQQLEILIEKYTR